jgi:hypothetical protein
MMSSKKKFVGHWPSDCEKYIAIAIYGKSLVRGFNFTSSPQVIFLSKK